MTCEVDKLFKNSKQEEGYTVFTLEVSNYSIIQLINLFIVCTVQLSLFSFSFYCITLNHVINAREYKCIYQYLI